MSAKSIEETENKEQIEDDLSDKPIAPPSKEALDMNTLAQIRAKAQAKQNDKLVDTMKKSVSLEFGVIGSGQGGSRLAETFYSLGYEAIAINSAAQDLSHIKLPDSNKLLLEGSGIGGAAKELEIGKSLAEDNRDAIKELIDVKLASCQIFIFCVSMSGGSGAGSIETIVSLLSETGKPVIVLTILPMESEDHKGKSNAVVSLQKLTELTKSKHISNLIVIDNAKLESIYSHVSPLDFFNVANKAIVAPLHAFNTYSMKDSPVKALDSMEFTKLALGSEALSIYGELIVTDYSSETSIAEAIVGSLSSNLLAGGFDIKQSKYVGAIFVANSAVWKDLPRVSFDYALHMIKDQCGVPESTFSGFYVDDSIKENVVKVYSMFTGLGLPKNRVEQLKQETKASSEATKSKDEQRNLTLDLDTGITQTTNAVQQIKDKIAAKSSAFGKLSGSKVIDRRKK